MGFQKQVLKGHVLGWCWGKALRLKALSLLLRRHCRCPVWGALEWNLALGGKLRRAGGCQGALCLCECGRWFNG